MKVTRSAPMLGGSWRGLNRTHAITLRGVRALLQRIFTPTAPEQGFAYDFADLTDAKINWRRNWVTESEFRNGLTDAPVRGGTGIAATALAPYAGGIAFAQTSGGSYAYKQMPFAAGVRYWLSVIVKMDDGNPPVFAQPGSADAGNDFALVMKGDALPPQSFIVTALNNGFYSVAVPYDCLVTVATHNLGIVKYASNSARSFKTTGYQVSRSGIALPYQYITDGGSGDFLREFPFAGLYQDHVGQVPVTNVEQPVGMALDMRHGGRRGDEMNTDVGFNNPAAWNVAGQSPGWSVANGVAACTATASGNRWVALTGVNLTVGKWYEVYADILVTSGGCLPDITANYPIFVTKTTLRAHWILQATSPTLQFLANGAFVGSIDNVSFREVLGNHALQPTTGDRPVMTGRLNWLLNSELVSDGVWAKSGNGTGSAPVITDNFGVAPDGTTTATRVQFALNGGTTAGDQSRLLQSITGATVGTFYAQSFWAKTNDGSTKVISFRDDFAGTHNALITVTPQWQQFFGGTNAATNTTVNAIGLWLRGTVGTADSADVLLWHPQLERSATVSGKPLPYQRVGTTATDYDPIGAPKGAKFNGVNSWMFTPVIDFAGSDKLYAGASFRKDADPTTAVDVILLEQGTIYTGGNGRVVLASSVGGSPNLGFYVRGASANTGAATVTGAAPPASSVVSGAVDWNVDTAARQLRVNGATISTGTGTAAVGGATQTGGAAIVYLGRRAGTGTSFNGVIYRSTMRGGDLGTVTLADRWLNEPIKVYT